MVSTVTGMHANARGHAPAGLELVWYFDLEINTICRSQAFEAANCLQRLCMLFSDLKQNLGRNHQKRGRTLRFSRG